MNRDDFWKIIDKTHIESKGNMDSKCELLAKILSSLDKKQLIQFSEIFDELDRESYSWELWAAAYILNGGCSDDSFSDFRSTLISMGKNTYLSAIENPTSLSTVEFYENDCCYEGYTYAINDVLEEKLGELPKSKIPFPKTPSGKEWEEDKVESLYPELNYLDENIEEDPSILSENGKIIVSNPLWLRLTIVFGILFLTFLGFFIIWQAFAIEFTPLLKSLFYVGMGLFILFAVAKGLPLLKFLSHSLLLSGNGIEIQKGKMSKIYSWEDIGVIKDSDTFQVLRIYDSSNKIIYAVDYYATNFYVFMEAIPDDS